MKAFAALFVTSKPVDGLIYKLKTSKYIVQANVYFVTKYTTNS